jgi:hypothetical protein
VLKTEEFAQLHNVKGASVRARFERTGSYYGIVPTRARNGRLLWPAQAMASEAQLASTQRGVEAE